MSRKLLDPQRALGDYLDDMLHLATTRSAPAPVVDECPRTLLPESLLSFGLAAETDTAIESQAADEATVAQEPFSQTGSSEAVEVSPEALEFPLQCLMFRVGGHLLSVPLIQLSSVVNWDGEITRLPQSADWMLGLVKHRDQNLRVVDSRQLLSISVIDNKPPDHLLVLGESRWAITCDRLGQVVNLDHADIQWKKDGSEHLVLGTIRDSLSSLLSPPGITALLESRVPQDST